MLAANNGWLLAFDNLSHISKPLSDALCRISTGGAFATRKLYSDNEEMLFEAQRPMVLNGIGEFITESDLLDRTFMLELPTLPAANRQDEQQFWAKFKEKQPQILGALLDAVSAASRNLPFVEERSDWPRMVDAARWVTAAEEHLGWPAGSFMNSYNANRAEANARVLDDDPLAVFVDHLCQLPWSGTATELLGVIRRGDEYGLPGAAHTLARRLREIAPNLREAGFAIDFGREGGASKKVIKISRRTARTV